MTRTEQAEQVYRTAELAFVAAAKVCKHRRAGCTPECTAAFEAANAAEQRWLEIGEEEAGGRLGGFSVYSI